MYMYKTFGTFLIQMKITVGMMMDIMVEVDPWQTQGSMLVLGNHLPGENF